MKLVVKEAESAALRSWLSTTGGSSRVTSALAGVEVVRAVEGDDQRRLARQALGTFRLLSVSRPVLDEAAVIAPGLLRSLDAIHLASATRLAAGLEAFVAYDRRLVAAAQALGLPVVTPT